MFSACANPDCKKKFDYREARLFRFHKAHLVGEPSPNTRSVQHFWLCGKCSDDHTLAYEDVRGVVIRHGADLLEPKEACRLVAVA